MRATIASIYPLELRAERPKYGANYKIPAVPKGNPPALLEINDVIQIDHTPYLLGHRETRATILGKEEIGPCVIREWTTNTPGMNPASGPGVWLVREDVWEVPPGAEGEAATQTVARAATKEEREKMFAEDLANAKTRQAAFFAFQIQEGDKRASEHDESGRRLPPTDLMKLACRYMGREREWLEELKDGDIKRCIWCTKNILVSAVVCPECGRVVDAEKAAVLERQQLEAQTAAARGMVKPPAPQPRV